MIFYEYPFNERMRTYLRVEQAHHRFLSLASKEDPYSHHCAVSALFELIEIASKSEVRADVIKDLSRLQILMENLQGRAGISEEALVAILSRIEGILLDFSNPTSKLNNFYGGNEFLSAVKGRIGVAAGTCSFDLPFFHQWQNLPVPVRQQSLSEWIRPIDPYTTAISFILEMTRGLGSPQRTVAVNGKFQLNLPKDKNYQILRVYLNPDTDAFPEVSCNKLYVSLRMVRFDKSTGFAPFAEDVSFDLTLCS